MLRQLKDFLRVTPNFNRGERWPYSSVVLTSWRPRKGVNFGDALSRVVVELLLARRAFTLSDRTSRDHQLLAIGSILHFAEDGAVIWGSGKNGKIPDIEHTFRTLDVRAVRGPLTREFLQSRGISVPEIYGDPALLLPHVLGERFRPTGERHAAFVPNLNDQDFVDGLLSATPIDPTDAWNVCVEEILKYKFVLASSLHGIIVAEAYGIPARYVRLTEQESLFKYVDYYAGTGRPNFSYAHSIAEGLAMGGERPPSFNAHELLRAFPYDLWEGK